MPDDHFRFQRVRERTDLTPDEIEARVVEARRLLSLLAELGWSTGYLGGVLGVSHQTVLRWLNGERHPPRGLAPWLAECLVVISRGPEGWSMPAEGSSPAEGGRPTPPPIDAPA